MIWHFFAKDESDRLFVFCDGFDVDFYEGFQEQLTHNEFYKYILTNDLNGMKRYDSFFILYEKNDDYNLEDCINNAYDRFRNNNRIFNKFPIHVLKNEYWYAIKDDDMIMEPTGKKQLMEF